MRGAKPIVSIPDEMAASTAYALASAGSVVTMPHTGNVGVIAMVADVAASRSDTLCAPQQAFKACWLTLGRFTSRARC